MNITSNIEKGDSLYNKIDKKLYLVLQVDYDKNYILLVDPKDQKFNIGTDPQTLSNFQIIKTND